MNGHAVDQHGVPDRFSQVAESLYLPFFENVEGGHALLSQDFLHMKFYSVSPAGVLRVCCEIAAILQ